MAPPPLQALISILHLLLLLAASMLLVADESAVPPPSGGGYSFELKRAGPDEQLHHMSLQIGEKSFVSALADTGSDLVWLKEQNGICSHPIKCGQQCDDLMDNTKCCLDHCMFERKYGDGSFARGFMVESKVLIEPEKTHKHLTMGCAVNFGCRSVNKDDCSLYETGGVFGLGRGRLSVLSQLVEKKFSFCLPGDPEVTSKIKFGDQATPRPEARQVKLIDADSSKYYVNLKNIHLVKDLEKIPMDSGSSYSMLIDSGCSFSKLPQEAFKKLTKLVTKHTGKQPKKNPVNEGFTCYDSKELPKDMPEMVLQFDGAEMKLAVENYMTVESSELCLAIKPGALTLGNFQMRNISMLFDLTEGPGTLAFWADDCAVHQ